MYVVFSDAYDGITCAYLNLVARSVFFHKFYMSMSIHFWALLALQISHSNLSNLFYLKKIEFAEEEVILCLKKVKENKFPSATSIFFKFPRSLHRLPAPPRPLNYNIYEQMDTRYGLLLPATPALGPLSTCCRCMTASLPSPTTSPSPSPSRWTSATTLRPP